MQPTTAASSLRECLPCLRVLHTASLAACLVENQKGGKATCGHQTNHREGTTARWAGKGPGSTAGPPTPRPRQEECASAVPSTRESAQQASSGTGKLKQEKQASQQLLGGQKKIRSKKPKETTKFKPKVEPPSQREGKDGKEAGTEKVLLSAAGDCLLLVSSLKVRPEKHCSEIHGSGERVR